MASSKSPATESSDEYNVGAAKAHLPEILDLVEQTGKEILLTRRGRPVARLVPVAQTSSILGAGQDDPNINHQVVEQDEWWGQLTDAETQGWYS
jgi:prevent-host-death family protein